MRKVVPRVVRRRAAKSVALLAGILATALAGHAAAQQHGSAVASGFSTFYQPGGIARVAVGAPSAMVNGVWSAGAVSLWQFDGSTWQDDFIDQRRLAQLFSGSDSGAEDSDRFGHAFVTADFDGDGVRDLAIGAPYEDLPGVGDAGCVHVLYGTPVGVSGPAGLPFYQSTVLLTTASAFSSWAPVPGPQDRFGSALAAGDLNRDGRADLIVGAPGRAIAGAAEAGAVYLFFGSANRSFPKASTRELCQGCGDSPRGLAEAGDNYGAALALGTFNGDYVSFPGVPILDLAVGAPGQTVSGAANAGNVTIYYGHTFVSPVFATHTNKVISQASPGLGTGPETGDRFGAALAAGNFNDYNCLASDPECRCDDLAVSAPNETTALMANAGWVNVLYGKNTGLDTSNNQAWTPSSWQGNSAQAEARFGNSLLAAPLIANDNGGCAGQACNPQELVIGEPLRMVSNNPEAGRIYVLKGQQGAARLTHQHANSRIDGPSVNARYGGSLSTQVLTTTPRNNDRFWDLLIGAPGWQADLAFILPGGANTVGSATNQILLPSPW